MKLEILAGKILGALRFCYLPLPAEVNEEEWRGDAESGGAKDYVVSLFYDEIKKAYMEGYAAGAIDTVLAIKEIPTEDLVFNEADNKIGAERRFLAWVRS